MNELDKYLDPTKFSTGELVYNTLDNKHYEFNGSTWTPYTGKTGGFNTADPGYAKIRDAAQFYGPSGGLQQSNFGTPGHNLFSEAFNLFKPTTSAETAKATSNYGMGATYAPTDYTGKTSDINGVKVYELKSGGYTRTGPNGETFTDTNSEAYKTNAANQSNSWTNPTTGQSSPAGTGIPEPLKGIQISNEADLQAKRNELSKAGIPQSDWSKYISSPDAQGRLFYSQPATLTSSTGEKKIVASGSTEASQLLSNGWKLGGNIPSDTNVISGDLLKNEQSIDLTGVKNDLYSSIPPQATIDSVTQTSKSIADYLKLVAPDTEISNKYNALETELSKLIGETAGQGTSLDEELKKLGVDKMKENLTSINNEIGIKTAALQSRLAEIGATPMTQLRQGGAEASARRLAQSDIMFLQAQAQAVMNNMSFAQETAKAAVDAKYNPILEQINIKTQQLGLLGDLKNTEEKKYATALDLYLKDQANAVSEQKANENQINDILLSVIANNPAIAKDRIIDQIKNAKSPVEAMQIAGQLATGTGWQYVSTIPELNKLVQAGYQTINLGGRIYANNTNGIVSGTKTNNSSNNGNNVISDPTTGITVDSASQSILAQTGLSLPAFAYMTQGTSALTRMTADQRLQYMNEAQSYLNRTGTDISTFQSQYKALGQTVESNSLRNNQAGVAETELDATLKNLRDASQNANLGNISKLNVAKIWSGQQLNDANSSTFKFHLQQLREEFAMYNAALGGQLDANGNIRQINEADLKRADDIIQSGFAAGSIDGFEKALTASRSKMQVVLQQSIDAQNKQVWKLFGVGDKYQNKAPVTPLEATPATPVKQQGFWSSVGNWLFGK